MKAEIFGHSNFDSRLFDIKFKNCKESNARLIKYLPRTDRCLENVDSFF